MKKIFIFVFISILLTAGILPANARDLVASMGQLPVLIEDKDKGPFVELVKAIDDVYTKGKIIREVYPFKRSLANVVDGKADFHIPLIKNPLVSEDTLPFRYSSIPTGPVAFVIYSHKDNPLTKQDISDAADSRDIPFPYQIDTLQGHADFFNFPVVENYDFESALKRVSIKRIDAIIMPQEECDSIIKKMKIKDIHRALYYEFDSMIILPKGIQGSETDLIITNALKQLKSEGQLEKINEKIHKPYIDWQPYKDNF
ncbi:Uncharacterized protein dnl_51680 [Desulfonema limicola]|uniref:Solute-binding protein family 3/N-terminal domain-containing protein n=1 Tax=Desulfonema limicola TaxID=45656 RepID=A0A975GIW3_9BACT|nr:ABC transporter substrate-binding protein [Desulfonema limicola]QTA82784.1 Uncharacterized protein dnl_51680 [Desulfonema limicola]